MVADGHHIDIPTDSVYSSAVLLCGLQLIIFLAELNKLCSWSIDIGIAYLEAKTPEKVYIVCRPEFGEKQDHTLAIYKAQLQPTSLRWHKRLANCHIILVPFHTRLNQIQYIDKEE